jgi:hypothetical protein
MKDIPAFPVAFKWGKELSQYNGMTLRDYFAAKAMQSILNVGVSSAQYADDAEQAYVIADAMLKARNGQN